MLFSAKHLTASLALVMPLTACKQPLAIFGQGDIVERLAGIRGCSLV
jgi:hypothetical protein